MKCSFLFVLGIMIFPSLVMAGGDQEAAVQSAPAKEASAQTASVNSFYTGDGGKGKSLGIGTPKSQGLNAELAYLPTMVQGVLVSSLSKYSAISVLDREALDRVIAQTLDPTFEDNVDIVRLGHVAQVGNWLTGNIIKTSSGYSLQINITDTTPNAKTVASYTGTCTVAQLDDYSAIHQASLSLLEQMGVALTPNAKNELNQASTRQYVRTQTALSQGITAQKRGTEIEALTYYYQAAAYDPSMLEAANRVSVLAANISSGNIGDDARNDVRWRRDWQTRLNEANTFFTNYIANSPPPCEIVYSTSMETGKIDYSAETMPFTFPVRLFAGRAYFASLEKAVQTVTDGLAATTRNGDWGLSWPGNFAGSNTVTYDVDFELVNSDNLVIGTRRVRLGFNWRIYGGNQIEVSRPAPGTEQVTIAAKVDGITDALAVRVRAVNGKDPQTANVTIIPINESPPSDNDFQFDRLTGELYGGSSNVTSIPATIWGASVTSIGNRAFEKKGLTSIAIPDSVTFIGDYAFANNQLTSLTIPKSVMIIGDYAFEGNPLSTVTIADSVKQIGKNAIMMRYSPVFKKNAKGIDTGRAVWPGLSITIGAGVNLEKGSSFGIEKGSFYTDTTGGAYTIKAGNMTQSGFYDFKPTQPQRMFAVGVWDLFGFTDFYDENGKKAGKYTYSPSGSNNEYQWFYNL